MNPSLRGRVCCPSLCSGSTDRFAAAALAGCRGGHCVWTHDFAPALGTAGGDVERCVVLGVPNDVTPATDERRLGAPVFLVDVPAHVAGLRCAGRIDLHERDSCFRGLVLAVLAELGERHVCSVSSRRLRQQFATPIGRAFLVTVYFAGSCGGALCRPSRTTSSSRSDPVNGPQSRPHRTGSAPPGRERPRLHRQEFR